MATQFQNRLVGTVILVALGVIFLPDLLDGRKQSYQEATVVIPLHPELEPPLPAREYQEPEDLVEYDRRLAQAVGEEPQARKQDAAAASADASEVAAKSPPPVSEPARTKADSTILANVQENAWVIRLGIFRNADNVGKLVARLKAAGYPAYSRPDTPIEGELNRVYVGPDVDKTKLERELDALKQLTALNGRIYRFNPLDD